jgi:hypothetical protein
MVVDGRVAEIRVGQILQLAQGVVDAGLPTLDGVEKCAKPPEVHRGARA